MNFTPTDAECQALKTALDAAGRADSAIARIVELYGVPEPRFRPHGFATLMRIIVSQQLSTKAAASIWARVETLCGESPEPAQVLSLDDQALRDCGLSWRKVEYSQTLAKRFVSNEMTAESLSSLDTEAVIKVLTTIKGFGVWSAEIYAMFALHHEDVFPAGDLALQVAIQRLLELPEKPNEKQTREIAERWSPHRAAVAVMLWKYYGATSLE